MDKLERVRVSKTSKYGRNIRPTTKMAEYQKKARMDQTEAELELSIIDIELKKMNIAKEIIQTQLEISQREEQLAKSLKSNYSNKRTVPDVTQVISSPHIQVLAQVVPQNPVRTSSCDSYIQPVSQSAPVIHPVSQSAPVIHPVSLSTPVIHPVSLSTPVIHPVSQSTPVIHPVSQSAPVIHPVSQSAPVIHPVSLSTPVIHPVSQSTPVIHPVNLSTPVIHPVSQAAPVIHQVSQSAPSDIVPIQSYQPGMQSNENERQIERNNGYDHLHKLMELIANRPQRPSMEPEVFAGDVLKFPVWIKSFEAIIERSTPSLTDKLYFLHRYTSGEARKVIEGYMGLNEEGFSKAKSALVGRYGNKYRTAEAFREQLSKWPAVKDGQSLQKFSDFLNHCCAAMDSISYLRALDSAEENHKLMKKLPGYLIGQWKRIIDRWLNGTEVERETYGDLYEGQYPPFAAFCKFVANEARIACGPGDVIDKTTQDRNRQNHVTTYATVATTVDAEARRPVCNICSNEHYAGDCPTFLQMPYDDRRDVIRKNGLCIGCLRRGHVKRDCTRRGPPLLLKGLPPRVQNSQATVSTQNSAAATNSVVSYKIEVKPEKNACKVVHNSMIVPVEVFTSHDPHKRVATYALLDNQSNACFVTKALASQLEATEEDVSLLLTTISSRQAINSKIMCGLKIQGYGESTEIELPGCYTRESIPVDKELIPRAEMVSKWSHLENVAAQMKPYDDDLEVGLLIGFNCSSALLPQKLVTGSENEPYATKTALGWSITGVVSKHEHLCELEPVSNHFAFRTHVKEISPVQVQQMFDIEFNEQRHDDCISVEDKQFLKKMSDGYQGDDGHFVLPLPLRHEVHLPNNREQAMQRLFGLKARLKKQKEYCTDYQSFMSKLLDRGYAERITPDPSEASSGKIWYIPHHGVYHPKEPNKFRVVFNCSAEFRGEALNRHLLSGPDLVNNLVGVLLRFRQESVAITCDIEAMFYQVMVNTEHRDYLRFLWFDGNNIDGQPVDYRMTVHLFGATSSPGCANFALKKTAKEYRKEFGDEASNFVVRNFYVDDGLKSVCTAEEAKEVIKNTRELCSRGGFNLTKFVCTEREVLKDLPVELQGKELQPLDITTDKLPMSRTLGIQWYVELDQFQFKMEIPSGPVRRRSILSAISSIYDPLGLISPFLLTGRQILQDICRDGLGWDDEVSEEVEARWHNWLDELVLLSDVKIPRCYKPPDFGKPTAIELHHFSDASTKGYGYCAYLRLLNSTNVTSTLVMSKSRVAPAKQVTIPRLELTAAVLSARMSTFLERELDYENIQHFFWTDSKVVLAYIANTAKRFHIYVANRVQEIRDTTDVSKWCYVESQGNPADLASRGVSCNELISSTMWWKGPEFLSSQDPIYGTTSEGMLAANDPEVRRDITVHTANVEMQPQYSGLIARLKRFSKWHNARCAVAHCLRYKRKLQRMANKCEVQDVNHSGNQLKTEEIEQAEAEIFKQVQSESFREVINDLASKKQVTQLSNLDPMVDNNGLLRVGGRLRKANLPKSISHPVILPKGSHITSLVIEHFHERTGHSGAHTTLSEIRASGIWITQARTAVNSHVYKCVTCKKLRAKAAGQKMADLPADRLEPAPPFTYSAVDFFGPFYVKDGRSTRKRYGALFTCLVSRAVHIEVACSLSTDSFINAYRRFIGRRGPIRVLRCDRGTNFVGARNELSAALNEMDDSKIHRTLLKEKCDWVEYKFNFPHSSHMGGVWERMVRTVRAVLSGLLTQHSQQLDDELLHTLIIEVEAIVNGRPLTNVSNDACIEPLTPSMLLTLRSQVVYPPPGNFVKEDMFCRKRWRRVQFIANEFWKRWLRELVPTLQERKKWTKPEDNLQVKDVVLVLTDDLPRSSWPLGIITAAIPSDDGLVRKVRVKISSTEYERPVHKLVFLFRPVADGKN